LPANTHGADINELSLGYFLNNEQWFSPEAEQQFKMKQRLVSRDEFIVQMERARAMSDEFKKFLQREYGPQRIAQVFWTARPGSLAAAVGMDSGTIDQRKNPTDILVKLASGDFLGISAKSTQLSSGKIGFKNPGLGTLDTILRTRIVATIVTPQIERAVQRFHLPANLDARKQYIRSKSAVQAVTREIGMKILKDVRNAMLKTLQSLTAVQLRNFVLRELLNAGEEVFPPYVKVTGIGQNKAKIEKPLSNPIYDAVRTKKLTVTATGETTIIFAGQGQKLITFRAKWTSEPLCSSIKFSAE